MGTGRRNTEWMHSANELAGLLQAEASDAPRRRRLRALLLLRRGGSIEDAAAAAGVTSRTVLRWLALYRRAGLEECLRRVPGHQARGRPPLLTPDQRRILAARAEAGAFTTDGDAVEWVAAAWDVVYTYQGMYTLLNQIAPRSTGSWTTAESGNNERGNC